MARSRLTIIDAQFVEPKNVIFKIYIKILLLLALRALNKISKGFVRF